MSTRTAPPRVNRDRQPLIPLPLATVLGRLKWTFYGNFVTNIGCDMVPWCEGGHGRPDPGERHMEHTRELAHASRGGKIVLAVDVEQVRRVEWADDGTASAGIGSRDPRIMVYQMQSKPGSRLDLEVNEAERLATVLEVAGEPQLAKALTLAVDAARWIRTPWKWADN